MPILRLLASLGLDKTGFDAGLASANKQVDKFGSGLKAQLAGAFSVAAVTAFAKSIVDAASQIKDLSDRLGVSAKDAQEFGLAAKLGGQGAETFARALEKIRLAMAGGKNPLAEFGITMKDMQSGDAVGVLRKLGMAMDSFTGSASQTKALADAFGARGMGGIVNMLRELRGAQGSAFFSDKDVDNLDRAGDAATKFWNAMRVGAFKAFEATGEGVHDAISFLFGVDLHNMVAKRRGGKGIPKGKTVADPVGDEIGEGGQKLADLQLKIDQQLERNRVAQMTDEERINDLFSQRVELVRQLQFALTKEAQAEIQLKIAQNAGDIAGLQKRAVPSDRGGSHTGIEESAFGRMGAFTGAAASASMPQQRQADLLNQIHQALVTKGIVVRDVAR